MPQYSYLNIDQIRKTPRLVILGICLNMLLKKVQNKRNLCVVEKSVISEMHDTRNFEMSY